MPPSDRPRALFVLLPLALCASCGDEQDESFSQLPCDSLEASCQDAVYRATAEVAQMRRQGRPPVRSISVAELEAELRELSELDASELELEQSWSTSLQLIGLLPAGLSVQEASLEDAVESISAYYDAEAKKVTVVNRSSGRSQEDDLFVLAHELAHALRDAESDLLAFRDRHVTSTDSSAASSALAEGEAMLVGAAVVARTLQGPGYAIDWERFAGSIEGNVLDYVEAAPAPLIAAVGQLPYAYGTQRLAFAWDLDGRSTVDALYEKPILKLLSWSGGRGARAEADPLQCFPTAPPAGYLGVDSDTLGLAALIALPIALETEGARAATHAGQAWRDDRVVIFRPEADPASVDRAVAWRLRFANASDARRFADSIGCCLPSSMRRSESGDEQELLYIAASAPNVLDRWSTASACGAKEDVPVAPMNRPTGRARALPAPSAEPLGPHPTAWSLRLRAAPRGLAPF
jgi:hypothetical protein